MSISADEATGILLGGLPPGIEQYYDLQPGGGPFVFYRAIAQALKIVGFDLVDILNAEVNPATMIQKIPDWENVLGLSQTATARFGTLAQRRNQVIGRLRENGGLSLFDIRAAMQPFLLYADPNQIQILEPNRAALKTLHTYPYPGTVTLFPNTTVSIFLRIPDDPKVSPAGATLNFTLTTTDLALFSVTLKGPPDGIYDYGSLGKGAITAIPFVLPMISAAGQTINKNWEIRFSTKAAPVAITNISLFIEALGRNYDIMGRENGEGLGAAMFTFAVVADLNLVGAGYNLAGAKTALQRVTPAHCGSTFVVKPMGGTLCAIPDLITTLPDASIPCDDPAAFTFALVTSPTTNSLFSVFSFATNDVWAVGSGGVIIHYNGSTWSLVTSPIVTTLLTVWGASSNDIWAGGVGGVLIHYNGTTWSTVTSPTANNVSTIFGFGSNNVWAVCVGGDIIHYDGSTWSLVTSPTTATLFGIWGAAANDIWAGGLGGILIHYNGTTWSTVTSPTANSIEYLYGLGPSDIWAVCAGGVLIHYNGISWSTVSTPTSQDLFGLWLAASNDIWVAGRTSTLLAGDGANFASFPHPSGVNLWSVHGTSPGDIWVVGNTGTILHGQIT